MKDIVVVVNAFENAFFSPTAVHQGPCLSFKLCCKPILTQQTWFCFLKLLWCVPPGKISKWIQWFKAAYIKILFFFSYPLRTKFYISYLYGYIYSIFMRRLIVEFLYKWFVVNHVSILFFSPVWYTVNSCLSVWYWAMCASSYVPERNLYEEWSK